MKLLNIIKEKCNIIKEKYTTLKMSNKKEKKLSDTYSDLAPVDKLSNGKEYVSALHWAIKNKRIKNIAITGPYGSGKSSIINAYLKRHPIIKKRHLRISMATFVEREIIKNKDINSLNLQSEEIEEGILKQLFYKVSHHKIPQSRYRKLHKVSYWSVCGSFVGIVVLIALFVFVFFPEQFSFVIEMVSSAGLKIGLVKKYSIASFVGFLVFITFILAYVWRQIQSYFKLKEIKVHNTTVKSETSDGASIFNKYMDEILYFFEETKYSIVFFEDLDRLDTPKIFIQLRELNTLLNNCNTIKRPIVFVYAVKDDIFKEEDRTKFFDFIIPVIPVINSTNSGEILLDLLRSNKSGTFKHDISQDYVLDISPFISDMRVLKNIYNEFLIYKRTLRTGQDLKLSDKLMMSLIIFKNLSTKDFADLQMETGVVKTAFEEKRAYIMSIQANLQSYIDNSTQLVEKVKNDALTSSLELKVAMMSHLTGWKGDVRYVMVNNNKITTKEILDTEFDLSKLCVKGRWGVFYYDWQSSNTTTIYPDDFADICRGYSERIDRLKELEKRKLSDIQSQIESSKQRKYAISSLSISALIEEYGSDEIFSSTVKDNKLLVFMLRRGYIDEKYVDYINYFKGSSITKDDMNFILGIKNHEPQTFDYPLSKTEQVLQRLQLPEFEQKEIYNFDLLEEMLTNAGHEDKLQVMMKQLSDGSDISWKFIDGFIGYTNHSEQFLQLISLNWHGLWLHIYNNPVLSDERKVYYLIQLFTYVNIEVIEALNSDQSITTFIEDHADFLQQLSGIAPGRVIAIISALKVSFSKLEIKNVDSEVLEFIFENRYYEITAEMISSIVSFRNESLCDKLLTQNYSVITALGYKPLTDYVHDNIGKYIDSIVLSAENTQENIPQILDLLQRSITDIERCKRMIFHEIFCLDDITTCCSSLIETHEKEIEEIWSLLFTQNKVSATWGNILNYWRYFKWSSALETFLIQHVDALAKDNSQCIDDDFKIAIIQSNIQSAAFEKIFNHVHLDNFDVPLKNISKNNVELMITKHFFEYTAERYNELSECYPALCESFIFENQDCFLKRMEETKLSHDVLEKLILNKSIDKLFKQKAVGFYSSTLMTESIARQLYLLEISIEKATFDAAWTLLDMEGRLSLLICNLHILQAADFQQCFNSLGDDYQELVDRSRRHDVSLLDNEKNRKLARRLQQIGYLTSYDTVTKTIYNNLEHRMVDEPIIKCRVKAMTNS